MKNQFKVGDKIRILNDNDGVPERFIGMELEVSNVGPSHVHVKHEDFTWHFSFRNIEHVKEEAVVETFKSTREIQEYLLSSGKVCFKNDPLTIVFYNKDGSMNDDWAFASPSDWIRYVKPRVPVKYSVEFWVKLCDINPSSCSIMDRLGFDAWNNIGPGAESRTKVRITVEEVSNED